MNRFMMKKVVTKMKRTNTKATSGEFFSIGDLSYPTESIAANIISGHISRVVISKKVSMEIKILSNLLKGWYHSLSSKCAEM